MSSAYVRGRHRASRGQTNAACPGKHTTRINNSYLKKAAGGRAGQGTSGALDAKDADWTTDDGHPIQDRPVRSPC